MSIRGGGAGGARGASAPQLFGIFGKIGQIMPFLGSFVLNMGVQPPNFVSAPPPLSFDLIARFNLLVHL